MTPRIDWTHHYWISMAACFAIAVASTTAVQAGFVDDFSGSSLNPAWGSVLTAPTQVTIPGTLTANNNQVSGGSWNISSMTYSGTGTRVGSVYVRRDVSADTSGDFVFDMDFFAIPALPNPAYAYLDAMFLDSNNNNVIGGGWFDNSTNNTSAIWQASRNGAAIPANGANMNGNTGFTVTSGGMFSMPNNGYGRLQISRVGTAYTVRIGMADPAAFAGTYGSDYNNLPLGTLINALPSTNGNAIATLQLQFSSLATGTETESIAFQAAIDRVALVPEPGSLALMAVGLVALVGVRHRLKRRVE